MNIRTIVFAASALLIPVTATAGEAVNTGSIDTVQVLKISSQDERAVIRTPDGKLQLIKVGDPIGGYGKVVEIASDRVVTEAKRKEDNEKVIIRLINGQQKIERLRKTGAQPALLSTPVEYDKKR